jgi:hypothetical protein
MLDTYGIKVVRAIIFLRIQSGMPVGVRGYSTNVVEICGFDAPGGALYHQGFRGNWLLRAAIFCSLASKEKTSAPSVSS